MESIRGHTQKLFSDSVISRDGGKCRVCNFNKLLEAAHFIPVQLGKSVIQSFGLSNIYDTRNGITLCKHCHWNFDNYSLSVDSESKIYASPTLLQRHPEYGAVQSRNILWNEHSEENPLLPILKFRHLQYLVKNRKRPSKKIRLYGILRPF